MTGAPDPGAAAIAIRDLTGLGDCRAVVAVEEAVWGRDAEIVPASVLLVSEKRGGILIGAFDGDRLVGFVWSMPGWKDGRPTHWSHMLGVLPAWRGAGLGARLKAAQRERALAQGVDLVEWTFDPLQAANAHLNLVRLGCVAATYLVNAYGEMTGPLHRGAPTDRLVAEWWLRRRRAPAAGPAAGAPAAIATGAAGEWVACGDVRPGLDAPGVAVPVPPRFGDMLARAAPLARAWRAATREAFTGYFARGYAAVGFHLDPAGGGAYLLARDGLAAAFADPDG